MTADWIEKDGFMVNKRLAALGLRHGVTTRKLGNMKDEAHRREAARLLGTPEARTHRQVHGRTQVRLSQAPAEPVSADGWIVDQAGAAAGIYVADCIPFFLWTDDGSVAGVHHAGWRGLGIIEAAARTAIEAGTDPKSLRGALGPHLRPCCYKVGPEFERNFLKNSLQRRGAALFLDMAAHARSLWEALGADPAALSTDAPCTSCGAELFFSFRRDKQDARMLAILSLDRW